MRKLSLAMYTGSFTCKAPPPSQHVSSLFTPLDNATSAVTMLYSNLA